MTIDDTATTVEETETVAPAAPAPKAAKPKFTGGKRQPKPEKVAKPAKKPAKKTAPVAHGRYSDDMVITVNTMENPRRPDTAQYEEYELIKKYRNKTVGAYRKAGGKNLFLIYAEGQKHVSVK